MARATDKSKLFQIPVTGGINQSVDQRDAQPGTLITVDNCRIKKSLLVQRPGFDSISASNVDSGSQAILGDGTTTYIEKPSLLGSSQQVPVLATTSGRLYASDTESSTQWFSEIGFVSTCTPQDQFSALVLDAITTIMPASAVNSDGYRLTAYVVTAPVTLTHQIIARVIDPNGKPMGTMQIATTTRADRIVAFAIGTTFYVVYNDDTGGFDFIWLATLGISSGALSLLSGPSTIVPQTSGFTTFFDAVPTRTISGSPCWALVYSQSGAPQVKIATLTGTSIRHGRVVNITTPAAGVPMVSLYWDSDYNYLWAGWTDTTTQPSYMVLPDDDVSATAIKAKTDLSAAGTACGPPLFGKYRGSTIDSVSTTFGLYDFGLGARFSVQSTATNYNAYDRGYFRPITKPDNYGRFWVLLSDDLVTTGADAAATYWFAQVRVRMEKVSSGTPGSTAALELTMGPFPGGPSTLDNLAQMSKQQFSAQAIGTSICTLALPCNLGTAIDVRNISWQTGEQSPHVASSHGAISLVTAGQPTEHQGGSLGNVVTATASARDMGSAEIGFPQVPKIYFTDTPGTASRQFRAVFAWADNYGRKHTSAPSLPVTATKTSQPFSIQVDACSLGQRIPRVFALTNPWRVYAEIYSTVDGGTEFFLSEISKELTASGTVSLSLTKTDDQLADQPILYTDGGVLANTLAPSGEFCVFTDDRLAVAGGFDRSIVTVSKLIIPTEPIQFTDSEAFQVVVAGDVTALGFLDGTLIPFTSNAIYQITGQGPNDQGIGEFDGPTLIWAGVGCSDHNSVLKTDDGILFLNEQGFYLLPRGLGAPQFIGAQVRDETRAYPTCLGAAITRTTSYYLARFLMAADGATSAGIILTFDLQRQIWFRDKVTIDGSTLASLSEIGAWPAGLVLMRESLLSSNTAPCILLEDETATADGAVGATQTQKLETTWVYPFQLGGYGHVRKCQVAWEILGTTATVGLSLQSDSNTAQTQSWTTTGTAGDIFYREMQVTPTQAGCVKVILTVAGGAGVRPVSCTLEIDDDSGIRLLSPSERV